MLLLSTSMGELKNPEQTVNLGKSKDGGSTVL
jgi:hypothetical protein